MSKIVIGIDPGSRFTGYGIVKMTGSDVVYIGSGCIKTGIRITPRSGRNQAPKAPAREPTALHFVTLL